MSILPKAMHRFNSIPIKIPMAFFTKLEQIILKFLWNYERPQITKAILQKKKKRTKLDVSCFLTILQSDSNWNSMPLIPKQAYISVKKNREPRNKPSHLWSINLWQSQEKYQWGRESLFSKSSWRIWVATCKRMKLEYFLNQKWTQNELNA